MKTQTALTITPEAMPADTRASLDHRKLAKAWNEHLEAQSAAGMLSERTAKAYSRNLGRWLSWLDEHALDLPTPAHVLAFVGGLRDAGLKAATINAHLDAVRGLYRWAETQNIYPAIARSVKGLRIHKDAPLDALPPEKVAALLNHVDRESIRGLRDAALVHTIFSTGLRLVSLCALNISDLDAPDAMLSYRSKGDREKGRRAYLSPGALSALVRYLQARAESEGGTLAQDAPLFVAVGNRAKGSRLSARSVRRSIVSLMEAAGHVKRDALGHIARPRVLSAHSLRRSAVTAAYDAQGLEAAQTLAGHADPKTTARAYARVQKGRVLRGLSGVLDLESITNKGEA